MNPYDQKAAIPGIKNVIVVGSGKGGVGKSTVSVNLAAALSSLKMKVGILDADIYGPSLPRMMGAVNQKPEVNESRKIVPLRRHGMKIMSMGFLVEENLAVVWRGPMLFKAMDQFFRDVDWGDLDVLIVDLPPGTGDVALTVAQKIPVTGAITVSTPQNVALADVKKAIDMFSKIGIPHLGLVENMAYFIPPGSKEQIQLFPKGELDVFLNTSNIPKLAQIPFNPQIGLGTEAGMPSVVSSPSSEDSKVFLALAEKVISIISVPKSTEAHPH